MKHIALIVVLCSTLALSLPIQEDGESEVDNKRSSMPISQLEDA